MAKIIPKTKVVAFDLTDLTPNDLENILSGLQREFDYQQGQQNDYMRTHLYPPVYTNITPYQACMSQIQLLVGTIQKGMKDNG